MELKTALKNYFKRAPKRVEKSFYEMDEVLAEMDKRREFTFENHCKDVYYWFKRNFAPYHIKSVVKHWYQRRTRGWDDSDCWSLDHTIANFVLPRLIQLKKDSHGYPSQFETPEEWDKILDEMIYAMDFIAKGGEWDCPFEEYLEKNRRVQAGCELFGKYFRNLWD